MSIIFKSFLKTRKIDIIMFFVIFIGGWVASYIYIGGPKTTIVPISIFIGFCLGELLAFRSFKKENNENFKV